jgi:hypothetical protein
MPVVTIEGTLTPAAGVLKRGEQATVTYTARIERLVKRGFVKIVTVHMPLPVREPDTPLPVGDYAPADEEDEVEDEQEPLPYPDDDGATDEPGRNASKEAWREFLTAQGVHYPESASRDDLVAGWVQLTQQQAGGS